MEQRPLYGYSPISRRTPRRLPDDARLAVWVGVNIEHYPPGPSGMSLTPFTGQFSPDPLNEGWRDYGPRVGIWRMIELFDRLDIRASVLLNSDVCEHYPEIIEAGVARDWAWLAHGRTNNAIHTSIDEAAERSELEHVVATIAAATGRRPRGWLGPALCETYNTPRLLGELGLEYTCDWCADDQPFATNVSGLISIPYSIELNDATAFLGRGVTGPQFHDMVTDQFDVLYEEGRSGARVMCIALHPMLIGQPFRHKHLAKALEYIAAHDRVWLTTSDKIATWYMGDDR